LDDAEERIRNNMPPLEECIAEWSSLITVQRARGEYIEKRKKYLTDKENLPVEIPLRRKPEERPTQFQDDKTGFYMAYGKFAPFKFYPSPSNMKYYKGMKLTKMDEKLRDTETETVKEPES
jgi:hypothetical protein